MAKWEGGGREGSLGVSGYKELMKIQLLPLAGNVMAQNKHNQVHLTIKDI